MKNKQKNRRSNTNKRKKPPSQPPIDYSKIPESGCPAKVGIWPFRRICGHKYFIPLIMVKVVPDTHPVCFGMAQSPFVICEKCRANLRDELDAESAALFRGKADKFNLHDKLSNINKL